MRTFKSINPYDGAILGEFEEMDEKQIELSLNRADSAFHRWSSTPIHKRCELLRRLAEILRTKKEELARLITLEMGKLIVESRAEIEKCAWVCDYYAEHAEEFTKDEIVKTDAKKSYVAYQPLGTILAVMPWNFPFWQVIRFAAPALSAGNTALLKHASNVPQCAIAIENLFKEADFLENVFQTLLIPSYRVDSIIRDPRIRGVTLTGSEYAGSNVAASAGRAIKKTVLELGGSDAFLVLKDADIDMAVKAGVSSRFLNAGQSCIAAKRFILVKEIADEFLEKFKKEVESLKMGDPLKEDTTLAPMARFDLRDELHKQVEESIRGGALPVTGCQIAEGRGAFYMPSILDNVVKGCTAYNEELFGPVAIVIRVEDEEEGLMVANDSPFGLGGSVWSRDRERAEAIALKMQCGLSFVNSIVKSDPRLPFGGIKASGYGRELSYHGMREFLNIKTIYIT
ncbi:MAG: NAD-dependent succinate-semialdehyde dehydrogenase [Nitrospirae bacterium]|nr:MAG: NAD-dependent succinate-semialdehyde dehydrogenase [Nitrospirota bacterium]